jgi:hypothetical protein
LVDIFAHFDQGIISRPRWLFSSLWSGISVEMNQRPRGAPQAGASDLWDYEEAVHTYEEMVPATQQDEARMALTR